MESTAAEAAAVDRAGGRSAVELCVCLDAIFPQVSVAEACRVAREEGITLVEFWDWRDRDVPELARAAHKYGIRPVIFSGNTFDEPLVDRSAHGRALAHLRRSLNVADHLGVRLLTVHVGYVLPGQSREEQWAAAVDGLRAAGDLAASAGVTLALEPLNSRVDHPGYFLDTLPAALRMLAEVEHPAVRLLVDVYHMCLMHADLLEQLPAALRTAAHVHVADVPGRGEPESGTIPWPAVMEALRAAGYHGAVGLECWPTGTPEAALRRSAEALRARARRTG